MKRLAIFCFLFVATAALCTAGMKVKTKTGRGTALASYETYAWKSQHDAESEHILAAGSPSAQILESVADPMLRKYGLSLESNGEPDLLVRYTGVSREMLNIEGTTRDLGGNATWIGDPHAHSMMMQREGTLLLEIVDAVTEKLVWAGWATDAVDTVPNPVKITKKIEKATKKILKELP
ncbi:MAG: DUF4136 domain-containing protein [Acidobacteriota bacterium]|nr:DUF4136 domain-containing protein [Acidobacteriota bacterium]